MAAVFRLNLFKEVRLEAGRPITVCGRDGMVCIRIPRSQNVSYRAGRTCVYMKLKKEPADKWPKKAIVSRDFR